MVADLGDLAAAAAEAAALQETGSAEERNGFEMLSTETKLTELVNRLKEFAAANLECVILFGSAARGEDRKSVV